MSHIADSLPLINMPSGPVADPADWRGPEVGGKTEWVYRLEPQDLADLSTGMAAVGARQADAYATAAASANIAASDHALAQRAQVQEAEATEVAHRAEQAVQAKAVASEQQVAELLGVPYETVALPVLAPIAYTKGTDFKPAARPEPDEVIHWDRW